MAELSLLSILLLGWISGFLVGLWVHPRLLALINWLSERRFNEKESEKEKQGD